MFLLNSLWILNVERFNLSHTPDWDARVHPDFNYISHNFKSQCKLIQQQHKIIVLLDLILIFPENILSLKLFSLFFENKLIVCWSDTTKSNYQEHRWSSKQQKHRIHLCFHLIRVLPFEGFRLLALCTHLNENRL